MSDAVTSAIDDIDRWLRTGPLGLSEQQVRDLRGGDRDGFGGVLKSGVSSGVPIVVQIVTQALLTVFFTFFVLKDGDRMWAWVLHRAGPTRRSTLDAMGREAMDALAGLRPRHGARRDDRRGLHRPGVLDPRRAARAAHRAADVLHGLHPDRGLRGWPAPSAVLIALADGGITKAAIALGIVLLVQQIEGNVIQPVAVGRQVRLHPIVTIAAVAVGGTLGGIVGAALAVPIVAIAYRALEQLRAANLQRNHESILAAEPLPGDPQAAQAGVVVRAR